MRRAATILLMGCCFLTAASCLDVAGAAKIGGPMNIDGPLHVQGNLYIGGPATIHGPVFAKSLTVGGPLNTTFPKGEVSGAAGQTYGTSLMIGGPLTVQGPLIVEGDVKVGGPLYCESTQALSDLPTPQVHPQPSQPALQHEASQQDWTE